MNYQSSIVNKYGDRENVKRDAGTILEIIGRQGIPLLLDVIAESCGETANKFSFSNADRTNLIRKYPEELKSALSERL